MEPLGTIGARDQKRKDLQPERVVKDSTEKQVLGAIIEKLDRLIGLFVTQGRTEDQQIAILREMGYDWNFIGMVVGVKPDSARMRHKRRANG